MPVIVEPRYDIAALEADLGRVYADFPGRSAADCVRAIQDSLRSGGVFYLGEFNGKPVAGALVSGPADTRRIQLVAVRPATRNRGVSVRLIDEIARLEHLTGAQVLVIAPGGEQAANVLSRLGFVPDPRQPDLLQRPLGPAG
ncbi:MAG: acetyl-CoA sensor PanZ family protein [Pseudomonadota bacterium]